MMTPPSSPTSPVMKPFWYWFCMALCLLDRIPRYGRVYLLQCPYGMRLSEAFEQDLVRRVKQWRWQRSGLWGFHLLVRLGMLWDFCLEREWRQIQEQTRRSGS